jgi:nuclear pore complex protein Nup107
MSTKKLFPCLKSPLICFVLFLSHLQVSVSLMGSGVQPDSHDNLIELVGSPETRFLDLFSQQQLQARYYFLKKY